MPQDNYFSIPMQQIQTAWKIDPKPDNWMKEVFGLYESKINKELQRISPLSLIGF